MKFIRYIGPAPASNYIQVNSDRFSCSLFNVYPPIEDEVCGPSNEVVSFKSVITGRIFLEAVHFYAGNKLLTSLGSGYHIGEIFSSLGYTEIDCDLYMNTRVTFVTAFKSGRHDWIVIYEETGHATLMSDEDFHRMYGDKVL